MAYPSLSFVSLHVSDLIDINLMVACACNLCNLLGYMYALLMTS